MDWAKVDAPLAAALAGASADDALPVFVHVDRSAADTDAHGDDLDLLNLAQAGDVGTASLSPAQVDALTERDWVVTVRLSGRLRLLAEPGTSASQPAGDQDAGRGHDQGPTHQDEGKHRPT